MKTEVEKGPASNMVQCRCYKALLQSNRLSVENLTGHLAKKAGLWPHLPTKRHSHNDSGHIASMAGMTESLTTHMDGCENYGPLLGPLNARCRIILRTQKGTIILTTTHMS